MRFQQTDLERLISVNGNNDALPISRFGKDMMASLIRIKVQPCLGKIRASSFPETCFKSPAPEFDLPNSRAFLDPPPLTTIRLLPGDSTLLVHRFTLRHAAGKRGHFCPKSTFISLVN
jgi:hypothetical protein